MHKLLAFILAWAAAFTLVGNASGQERTSQVRSRQRFVYVPFEDLDKALESQRYGVVLKYGEYLRLLRKAEKEKEEQLPLPLRNPIIHSSSYYGRVDGNQVKFSGLISFTVHSKEYQRISLPFGAVGITAAKLDGEPANIILHEGGYALLLNPAHAGSGHKLELNFAIPLKRENRGRSLGLRIPPAPSSTVTLEIPGRTQVTVSPGLFTTEYSMERDATTVCIRAGGKDFILAHMAAEEKKTNLEPFVTAKTEFLVHLNRKMVIVQGSLSIDIYRRKTSSILLSIPANYRITELRGSDLLDWREEKNAGKSSLSLKFRKPVESVKLMVTLEKEMSGEGIEEIPRVEIPGALTDRPLIQIIPSDDITFEVLSSKNLHEVNVRKPGFPKENRIPVKAFVGWPLEWSLLVKATPVKPVVRSLLTALVTVDKTLLSLNFLCTFEVQEGGLYSGRIRIPGKWEVLSVATDLVPEDYDYSVKSEQADTLIEIHLSRRLKPGSVLPVSVAARSIPENPEWEKLEVDIPRILPENASLRLGTIVFRANEAVELSGEKIFGLMDLDISQIENRGITPWKATLGYEIKKQDYFGTVSAVMKKTRTSATCVTCLAINESLFQSVSLLLLRFEERPTGQFQFILPKGTGGMVDIRGRFIKEKSLHEKPDGDHWEISLQKEITGEYPLFIAYDVKITKDQLQLEAPKLLLPGDTRCDGFVGIEAGQGTEILPEFSGLREIPVASMPLPDGLAKYYSPGRSLIHAFRFIGTDYSLKLKMTSRFMASVITTVVPNAYYKTVYSLDGIERTRALFEISSANEQFFRFRLPENSRLWSVLLGRRIDKLKPVKPVKRGNMLMVPLVEDSNNGNGKIFYVSATYECPYEPMSGAGRLRLTTPTFEKEVPVLQSSWRAYFPKGYRYNPLECDMASAARGFRQPTLLEYSWIFWGAVLIFLLGFALLPSLLKGRRLFVVLVIFSSIGIIFVFYVSVKPQLPPVIDFIARSSGAPSPMDFEDAIRFGALPPLLTLEEDAGDEDLEEIGEQPRGWDDEKFLAPEPPGVSQGYSDEKIKKSRKKEFGETPELITQLAEDIRLANERQKGLLSMKIALRYEGTPLAFHSLSSGGDIDIEYVSLRKMLTKCFLLTVVFFMLVVVLRKKTLKTKLLLAAGGIVVFSFVPRVFGIQHAIYCNAALFGILAGTILLCTMAVLKRYKKVIAGAAAMIFIFVIAFNSVPAYAGGEYQQRLGKPAKQAPVREKPLEEEVPLQKSVESGEEKLSDEETKDIIIIPYDPEKLDLLPGKGRVHVPVGRYEELLRDAGLLPEEKQESPRLFSVNSANYAATILDDAIEFTFEMKLELLRLESADIFIGFPGMALSESRLDGEEARIRSTSLGYHLILVDTGPHTFSTKFRILLDPEQVRGEVEFPVRPVPCASMRIKTVRTDIDIVVGSAIGSQSVRKTSKGLEVEAALGAANSISISYGPPSSRITGETGAIDSQLSHYFWISESLVLIRCDARLNVSGERRDIFTFLLPEHFEPYQVVSQNEIMAWRVIQREKESDIFEVILYEPIKNTLELTINGAYILAEKTTEVNLPFLQTSGARKESGSVSIFLADTLRADIGKASNLIQVASHVKTRDNFELYTAYRYSTRPIEVTIATSEKESDTRADIYTQLAVTKEKLYFKTSATIKVTQAPIFDFSLYVPDNFEIQDIICPQMASRIVTEEENRQKVTIHLKNGFMGSIAIIVSGSRLTPENLDEISLPQVSAPSSKLSHGFIVISSERGIDITTRKTENLFPVDVRTVPYPRGSALEYGTKHLAFAWKRPDYSGTIGVESPFPVLDAQCVTSVLVREEVISYTTIIRYAIKSAPCRKFSFSMPWSLSEQAMLKLPFMRQRSVEKKGQGDEARAVFTVELQRELTDSYHLAISWDKVARDGENFAIPWIAPENVDNSQVYALLQNQSGLKVAETSRTNLEDIDSGQIPMLDALLSGNSITLVASKVRDTAQQYDLSFSIERLIEEQDLKAIIDIAEIVTIMNKDGQTFNEVSYRIQNRTKQYLRVRLPKSARLWSAEVENKLVKPTVDESGKEGVVFIPLLKRGKGEMSYNVKLFYSLELDSKPGFASNLSLVPPKPLDINVGQTFWTVHAPDDYNYTGDGNMEEIIESVREVEKVTSYAREAQRLVSELESTSSVKQQELITGNLEQFNKLIEKQLDRAREYQEKLVRDGDLKSGKFMEQYNRNINKLNEAQVELAKNIRRVQEEKAKLGKQVDASRANAISGVVTFQAEQNEQAGEFLKKAQKRVREQIAREEQARKDISSLDRLSNKNLDSTSCIDAYGIGGGRSGAYGQRWGKGSLAREGGSPGTESAVTSSLRWLHFHQDDDGKWDQDGFQKNCDTRSGPACDGQGTSQYDVACTGMALLAFFGHGHTHRVGLFKKTVKKGLEWLTAQQKPDGSMGDRLVESWIYNHAIGTMALCEAYAVTRDYRLKYPAQKAVDFIRDAQNPGLGWKYNPRSGHNDTSVTGWMVMALKAAKTAGLNVEQSMFDGAINWFDRATNAQGKTGYIRPGDDGSIIRGVNENYAKLPTMTAAAILCRIFCGQSRRDPKIIKGVEILQNNLPRWNKPSNTMVDFYYWYYGTYAMFQYGGQTWQRWNRAMKHALLDNQRIGGCTDGSWDPVGKWGIIGGRVYATAMNSLTLQIYYRYARAHPGGYDGEFDWKETDKDNMVGKRLEEDGFLPPDISLPRTGRTLSFKKLGADPVLVLRSSDIDAFTKIVSLVRMFALLLLLVTAYSFNLSFLGEKELINKLLESLYLAIAAIFIMLSLWSVPALAILGTAIYIFNKSRMKVHMPTG